MSVSVTDLADPSRPSDDVNQLIRTLADWRENAWPTMEQLRARIDWDADRLALAVAQAERLGLIHVSERPIRTIKNRVTGDETFVTRPAVMLTPLVREKEGLRAADRWSSGITRAY